MKTTIQKAVTEHLATKDRPSYLLVHGLDQESMQEASWFGEFTEADIEGLRGLKAKYGQEYVKHLQEFYQDEDSISDLGGEDIEDIDLDGDIYRKVRFVAHAYKEGQLESNSLLLILKEPVYARLVEVCILDPDITFNNVFRYGRGLAAELNSAIWDCLGEEICGMYWDKYPFFVTMDEAKDDADAIVKSANLPESAWFEIPD